MQSLLQSDLFLQVSGITSGRAAALVPLILGLISVIIGRIALVRSKGPVGSGRSRAILALILGSVGVVLSVLHWARATGAIGSGSGKLGAIVGLVLGLIGVYLGRLAEVRSRRNEKGRNIESTNYPRERS